jgi:integrase
MRPGTALALKLQLVTAQRRGEVISMRWEDVSDDIWTIPAEHSKNGLPHRVPLSPLALELLGEAKQLAESPWVFPGLKPTAHLGGNSVNHALQHSREVLKLSDLTPHDLRRTAATYLAGLRVPRLVIAKILNHSERGVTAVYDRHSYDEEKRQALDAWSQRLHAIVHGNRDKVVSLRANISQPAHAR